MFAALKGALRPKAAPEIAQAELENARRELLVAQTLRDYAETQCQYHQQRITRLRSFIKEESND